MPVDGVLSDPDTTQDCRVEGLPMRAEGDVLVAPLDENGTGSVPDSDVIIALNRATSPRLVLVDGDEATLDVVLSANPP